VKVVTFCRLVSAYWYECTLVQDPRCWSFLLLGSRKREKVVAFCRWVHVYWYESAPVQDCKIFYLY